MRLESSLKSSWRVIALLALSATTVALTFAFQGGVPATAPITPATAIEQQLREFNVLGTVLYVAAHPDDENSQLITYMARGRHYRAAYLALTRGDGGQNAIGPEFGEELGVIRTQELLAARRIDGGRQFFTRAIDFGYSKSSEETLRIWDRQQVLSDVVHVIRRFRPDVMITGSSPESARLQGKPSRNSTRKIQPPAFHSCCRYDPKRQSCLRTRSWMRSASCWTRLSSIVSGSPWNPPRLRLKLFPEKASHCTTQLPFGLRWCRSSGKDSAPPAWRNRFSSVNRYV
jgi:hypothetical protein